MFTTYKLSNVCCYDGHNLWLHLKCAEAHVGSLSRKLGLQRTGPLLKTSDGFFRKGAVPSNPGMNGKVWSHSVHVKSVSGTGVKWSGNCSWSNGIKIYWLIVQSVSKQVYPRQKSDLLHLNSPLTWFPQNLLSFSHSLPVSFLQVIWNYGLSKDLFSSAYAFEGLQVIWALATHRKKYSNSVSLISKDIIHPLVGHFFCSQCYRYSVLKNIKDKCYFHSQV